MPRPRTLQEYRIAASRQPVSCSRGLYPAAGGAARGFRLGPALLVAVAVHVALLGALTTVRVVRSYYTPPVHTLVAQVGSPLPAVAPGPPATPLPSAPAALAMPDLPPTKFDLPPMPPVITVVPTDTPLFADPSWTWPSRSNTAVTGVPLSSGPGASDVGGGTDTGGTGTGGDDTGTGPGIPMYRRPPQPRYPAQARQQGWEGTAVLRVEVRANGAPGAVAVVQSSGHAVLDDAAIAAVRGARFQVAQPAWVEVPITFRLNRSS